MAGRSLLAKWFYKLMQFTISKVFYLWISIEAVNYFFLWELILFRKQIALDFIQIEDDGEWVVFIILDITYYYILLYCRFEVRKSTESVPE